MSLKSMTGYGTATGAGNGFRVEIQITSVNKKQPDISITLSSAMSQYEHKIDAVIRKYLSRGTLTIDVKVLLAPGLSKGKINAEAFSRNVKLLRDLAKANNISPEIRLLDVLGMPDVICRYDIGQGFEPGMWIAVSKALTIAIKKLAAMREVEGKELEKHIRKLIDGMDDLLGRIKERRPQITASYRNKLAKRITDSGVCIDVSDPLLMRELAVFADRSDISEEIVRLESHFKQADRVMKSGEPAGRILDFLCQEMFREINTIGSKANDSIVSETVVGLKAQLEKIREQVQNVE